MSYVAKEKQINLSIESSAVGKIIGDKTRILEVINNMIYNAIDFSPANIGMVNVSVTRIKDMVEFSVTDNGIGIPKKKQSKLFNKFYQANPNVSASRKHGGTGLWLSICKGLMTSMVALYV